MRILKKGVPFYWDELAQLSFDALKHAQTSIPLLLPLDYNKYFLLYLATTESTISMVLVKENDLLEEHVIYYLSHGLVGLELNYSHVENLALAVVHVVQWFCHYILLGKTIVIAIVNPFQYMLTWHVIKENISIWIIILQEFDLDFVSMKFKKSLVFVEHILELPVESGDVMLEESPIKGDIFLISSSNPWYGYIMVYI